MGALVVCFDAGVELSHKARLKSSLLLSELRMMSMWVEPRVASQCLRAYFMQPVDALEVFQNAEEPRQQNQGIFLGNESRDSAERKSCPTMLEEALHTLE